MKREDDGVCQSTEKRAFWHLVSEVDPNFTNAAEREDPHESGHCEFNQGVNKHHEHRLEAQTKNRTMLELFCFVPR